MKYFSTALLIMLTSIVELKSVSAQSAIKIGNDAPPINVTDWLKHKPISVELRNRMIVLEFWATWCGPCIQAVPHMNELQEKYDPNDVLFLSLTYEHVDKVNRTLNRIPFSSAVATDSSRATQIAYGDGKTGLEAYPLSIVIDKENKIRWIGQPTELTHSVIDEIYETNFEHATKSPSLTTSQVSKSATAKNTMVDLLTDQREYILDIKESSSSSSSVSKVDGKLLLISTLSLQDIYKDIFGINEQLVSIPGDFQHLKFDITYKNDDPGFSKFESRLLEFLMLKKHTETKKAEEYVLSIINNDLLEPNNESMFTSKSDAGDKIIFTAYTLDALARDLSTISGNPFRFDKESSHKFDFIIDITSLNRIIESLYSYGIQSKSSITEAEMIYLKE